jgi:protoporphyrinogen oxidase
MYEAMAQQATSGGAKIFLNHDVIDLAHNGEEVTELYINADGVEKRLPVSSVISSMPIDDLISAMRPAAPEDVKNAAKRLRYRSLITVNLIIDAQYIAPDNWIYMHDLKVRACRLQLYKNWSAHMSSDPAKSPIGLEYFCYKDDRLWTASDEELIDIALRDLAALPFSAGLRASDGFVVRCAKAYPVYEEGYKNSLNACKSYLANFLNLQTVGRYGQFRYNNMDHSILTGLYTAAKFLGKDMDPWEVNTDSDFLG